MDPSLNFTTNHPPRECIPPYRGGKGGPLISLITATYNSASTIQDTLRSVAAQEYPRIEHLIIDGLSKDNTLELVGQFPHVQKVVSERDRGIYDAMNKGIALATGDIVGIINSDDFYHTPQVLSKVAAMMEQSGAGVLYGDLEYVDAVDTGKVIRHWKSGTYHNTRFHRGWMPPHPTFFVRRELYAQFGGFNTDLRFSADYELMLRFLVRHRVPVCYLPEVMVRMRMGGASNASLRNRLRANREDRLAWEINGLKPRFYTLVWKPLSKIGQFVK